MFKKTKKVLVLSLLLSLMVGSVALAALPNKYGKNYDTTKNGHICKMVAKGNSDSASTTVKNTANSTRYYSAYVNRRNADSNRVIESDATETLVGAGKKITASVARYRSADEREHHHKAMSWNCSMRPEGAGYTNFLDDTLTYTIKQRK